MGKHGKLPCERTVVSIITIPLNLDPSAALEIKLLIDEHSQGFGKPISTIIVYH